MGPGKIFDWLIVLTVAAGLLTAPLAVPAMAAQQPATAADAMQAMDTMQAMDMTQAMADEMPCCPGQDQKARDCGSCPFIALCTLTISLPAPHGAGALVNRTFSRRAFALPDDLLIDGLGEHPPDHPPRTIV